MIEEIKRHCLSNTRQEMCGLIALSKNDLHIIPCRNVDEDPEFGYEISYDDFLRAEKIGDVVGVFHSHTERCSDLPSLFDVEYAEITGYFNIVYINRLDKFEIVDPE